MALRIFKTIATSGFLAALECIKFVFGRGSAPDPLGSLQRSPDVLAGSRGPPSIRKDRAGKVKGKGGKKKERKAENRGTPPISQITGSSLWKMHLLAYLHYLCVKCCQLLEQFF